MTYVDLDQVSSAQLIALYVVECRGQGHFLPYIDHQIIQEWLTIAPHADDILLILSELLPDYFERQRDQGGKTRSLAGIRRRVYKKLKEKAMQGGMAACQSQTSQP